jgi:WD40 repeat protein
MISCAECNHTWESESAAEVVCPACGMPISTCGNTVEIVGTVAGATQGDRSASPSPDSITAAVPADPIATTIQSDRWTPSVDEIRDIANLAPELMQRLTTTGMFAPAFHDETEIEPTGLSSLSSATIDQLPAETAYSGSQDSVGDDPPSMLAAPATDTTADNLAATFEGFEPPPSQATHTANLDNASAGSIGATFVNRDGSDTRTETKNTIESTVDEISLTDKNAPATDGRSDAAPNPDSSGGADLGATFDQTVVEIQADNRAFPDSLGMTIQAISGVTVQGVLDATVPAISGGTVQGVSGATVQGISGATVQAVSGATIAFDEKPAGPCRPQTIAERSPATIVGSGTHRSTAIGSVASSAAEAASNDQLEKTLVIQRRILRADRSQIGEPVSRSDYDLLKKLGEGGMGVVFSARQQSIRRVVALKMLKARNTHEVKQREKFLAEAVITGDLEHPNIVPIYDLGRDEDGAIFYAMKCVNGTPWDKLIHAKSQLENLEILMKVADAVAFAHSKNVVHRDLKPENVMLGDFGEVLVMDWGLAISTIAFNRFALGGTPAYMAPEMVLGPTAAIGPHSDIYLLGAILYEFVTGNRPHTGSTISLCLMAAGKNEIIPTDKSGELVQIAFKAMASDPMDRYASVREMQDAIREYLSHAESIALEARAQEDFAKAMESNRYEAYARALFGFQEAVALWQGNIPAREGVARASLAYAQCANGRGDYELGLSLLDMSIEEHQPLIAQLRKSQIERDQRIQRLKTARRAGLALVATIFAIVTTSFFWIRSEAEKARLAEGIAQVERADALFQKGVADEQRAEAISARLNEERERLKADEARVAERQAREIADRKRIEADQARADEEVQRALAEDAKRREQYEGYVAKIGLAAAKIEENAYDRSLDLLDECPEELRHWEWGRLKYLCSREIKKFNCGLPLETLALSPDGEHFAVAGWGEEVLIFALNQDQAVLRIKTDATQVFALAFSPDGKRLAIGSNERPNYLSVWDADTGKRVIGLEGHSDAVVSVAWSSDGKRLLTGSYDHSARLWDIADGSSKEYLGHDWWVWSASFSPDENRFVTASQDGSVIVWDVNSDTPGPAFTSHACPALVARFSPDGKTIASGGYDGRVLVWNPDALRAVNLKGALAGPASNSTPDDVVSIVAHSDAVRSIVYSRDGAAILTAGNDNTVRLWDFNDQSLRKEFRGHASRVAAAQFLRDEENVISVSHDHSAKIWDIPNHRELDLLGGTVLQGHRDSILGASFDPSEKLVVTASRDRSAISWDIRTGQQIRTFNEGHAYLASSAVFIPGGKKVLTVAIDNTSRIWDISTGTQSVVLEGTGVRSAAAVSSTGRWIATGSDRKSVVVWDLGGQPLREFDRFESDVTALAFSPDDRFLLVGDSAGRCQLIDAVSGQQVWVSRTHSRGITKVAYVPGGDKVLTASLDNVVAIRDSKTGTENTKGLLKHAGPVTSLAVSTDGNLAMTSSSDKKVRVWSLKDSSLVKAIDTGEVASSCVAISPDSKTGLAVMADRRIRMWNLQTGDEVTSLDGGTVPFMDLSKTSIPLWSAAFSDSGDRLLTAGGTEARIWEIASGKTLQIFSPQSAVASVNFSPSGERFVTGSWDNAARIWDTNTGTALLKLSGVHTRFVNTSTFSPDGRFVLTASDDRTAALWDSQTGELLGRYSGHEGRVTSATFSPDGTRVLTTSEDRSVVIWETTTFRSVAALSGHSQSVLCAAYSPDGKRIVTGGDDAVARLWDVRTGEPLPFVLDGHTASITAVAFSPDSKRVFTGSKDKSVKLWDPETGKEILTLDGHTQEITAVSVSPSGDTVLTAGRDGTAILWRTVPWADQDQVPLRQLAESRR